MPRLVADLFTANAILAVLYAQGRTDKGKYIDISPLNCQVAWPANVSSNYLVSGKVSARYSNAHPNIVPYQVFKARGRHFAFAVGKDGQWQRFCQAIGRSEWAEDERFSTNTTRVENRETLVALLAELFTTRKDNAHGPPLTPPAGGTGKPPFFGGGIEGSSPNNPGYHPTNARSPLLY